MESVFNSYAPLDLVKQTIEIEAAWPAFARAQYQ
jgi:hypothetical protein